MTTVINPAVMRPQQAAKYVAVSIATFWRLAKEDERFPQPFKLGANSTGVMRKDLDTWLEAKQEVSV